MAGLDALSYLIAALMTSCVSVPPAMGQDTPQTRDINSESLWRAVWLDWNAGLRLVRRDRMLYGIFIVWAVQAVAEGIFDVLLVPFANGPLYGAALQFGWLMSAQALGGLVGGLIIGQLGNRLAPGYLIVQAGLVVGTGAVAIWNVPELPLDLALMVVIGVPALGFGVGTTTLLQTSAVDEYRGRVSGALNTTWSFTILPGMVLGGVLGGILGTVPMLDVSAGLDLLTGLLAFVLLRSPTAGATNATNRR